MQRLKLFIQPRRFWLTAISLFVVIGIGKWLHTMLKWAFDSRQQAQKRLIENSPRQEGAALAPEMQPLPTLEEEYDAALALYRKADSLTKSVNLINRRRHYKSARACFARLGQFRNSQAFAKKADDKYKATFDAETVKFYEERRYATQPSAQMFIFNGNADQEARESKYLEAISYLCQAERLWGYVKDGVDESRERMLEYLSQAQAIFIQLGMDDKSKYGSHMLRIGELRVGLKAQETYQEAMAQYRAATFAKRYSSRDEIVNNLKTCVSLFKSLPHVCLAGFFSKRAENQLATILNNGPVFLSAEKPCEMPSILVNEGYDLCLRSELPRVCQELKTTTIITPQGAFQYNEEKGAFVCLLTEAKLSELGLDVYTERAKIWSEKNLKRRQSIQVEFMKDRPVRFAALSQALLQAGGHCLEAPPQSPQCAQKLSL